MRAVSFQYKCLCVLSGTYPGAVMNHYLSTLDQDLTRQTPAEFAKKDMRSGTPSEHKPAEQDRHPCVPNPVHRPCWCACAKPPVPEPNCWATDLSRKKDRRSAGGSAGFTTSAECFEPFSAGISQNASLPLPLRTPAGACCFHW